MPLVDLPLAIPETPPPAEVRRFLRAAGRRIEQFQDGSRVHAFVPSDYDRAYAVLKAVADAALARGPRFCEWGSGFGVVAGLASMLGFDASGIEIEAELVDAARELAYDFGLPVEFVQGSFVPPGAEDGVHAVGEYAWLTTEGDAAYEELGLDPADLDVVFAYPWPDEEAVTADLFDRYAGAGAVLVTNHAGDDYRARRKVPKRGRRR